MSAVNRPGCVLWLLIVVSSVFPCVTYASELALVVSGPTVLQLSPSLIVENSPGTKPGAKVKCERVNIHGLPRIKYLNKFANSVKVEVSFLDPNARPSNVEICFHRNVTLGVGMCPQGQWKRLTKGLWVKSMSPFDHKILDIRVGASYSDNLQASLNEEFFGYRIWFLVLGVVLMTLSSFLSESLVFYYSGAMVIGVFLVILVILFQGMKLLPTGRKSSLAVFLYSCFVGLGSFLLGYVPKLLQSLLVEIGLSEDMYNPLAIFLLVFLVITGAWLGFWAVRKLVLTEEGSIDMGVAYFITWSIRIVASVMILQSSVDPLLAAEALIGGIFVSSVLRRSFHRKVVQRVYTNFAAAFWCIYDAIGFGRFFFFTCEIILANCCRKLTRSDKINRKESLDDEYTPPVNNNSASRPYTGSPYIRVHGSTSKSPTRLARLDKINGRESLQAYALPVNKFSASTPYTSSPYTPGQGSTSKSPTRLSDSDAIYSTFHKTPDRKKFSKDEWEAFTRESTRKALEGLVSSPDFSKWAVAHADRITLAPETKIEDKKCRWFRWF